MTSVVDLIFYYVWQHKIVVSMISSTTVFINIILVTAILSPNDQAWIVLLGTFFIIMTL